MMKKEEAKVLMEEAWVDQERWSRGWRRVGSLELIFPFDTISGFANLLFFAAFSLILILFPELSYPFPEN